MSEKPLAVARPRRHKRKATAYLTRRQVLAAYTIYQKLGSVNAVARLGWQQWGYSSAKGCAYQLLKAFALEGFRQRNGKPFRAPHVCVGCGCPADERTFACQACKTRHALRRRRGLPYVPPRVAA